MVETTHDVARERLQRLEVIISEISIEARVDRGHSGNLVSPRPGDCPMPDDVGTGYVHHVRVELGEIAPHPRWKREREAIFGAAGNRHCRNVDDIAGCRECRLLHRRRIDPYPDALAQQIADQPVKRLVGSVTDIIVIAREEGDAEVGRLHPPGL